MHAKLSNVNRGTSEKAKFPPISIKNYSYLRPKNLNRGTYSSYLVVHKTGDSESEVT